jgi:hypothetical protein
MSYNSLFLDISSLSSENYCQETKNNNLLPNYMNQYINSLSINQDTGIFQMNEEKSIDKKEGTLKSDTLEKKLNRSLELEKYKQQIIQKYHEVTNYLKMVEKSRQDIENIEDIIYELCDHNWEYDYAGCGPHDGPDKVCKDCNLYRR